MIFKAYFNRKRAYIILLLSLVGLFYLWNYSQSETKLLQSTIPLVLSFYSLSQFRRVHLLFEGGTLQVFANYGPQKREFNYSSFQDFHIDQKKLSLKNGEQLISITEAHVVQENDWQLLYSIINKPSLSTNEA